MTEIVAENRVSVFNFVDYKEFLKSAAFPKGFYQHSSNTLKKWSSRLGYRSPSSLTMVLKGQRLPSAELTLALTRDLKLKKSEKEYFEMLIEAERLKRKNKDTSEVLKKLKALSSEKGHFVISLNIFSSIASWYYLVIKRLISTPSFRENTDWIYKRLRKKVSKLQITSAIDTMLELKILGRNEYGRLIDGTSGLMISVDIPSVAIKSHHEGMLNLGLEALTEQSVDERQISSLTVRLNPKRIPEAKDRVFEFLKEFNREFGDNTSDEIYQLNLQLFSHVKDIANQSEELS